MLALDAKINFDSNALFRHKELLRNCATCTRRIRRRSKRAKFDLSYIALDGNIGCMVNGAGLAMATMDVIKLHGGEPANFLDVGGGATKENVKAAFKILLSDDNVKGVLVNIFGGHHALRRHRRGCLCRRQEIELSVPLVVRLEGTNVEKGKRSWTSPACRWSAPRTWTTPPPEDLQGDRCLTTA